MRAVDWFRFWRGVHLGLCASCAAAVRAGVQVDRVEVVHATAAVDGIAVWRVHLVGPACVGGGS